MYKFNFGLQIHTMVLLFPAQDRMAGWTEWPSGGCHLINDEQCLADRESDTHS